MNKPRLTNRVLNGLATIAGLIEAGDAAEVAASRLDDIRAAYSETEHIAFPENQIRLIFRKSDAPGTPTQATEQE